MLVVVVATLSQWVLASRQIPAKYLGSWEVDHSENFDEYLEAKGYGWFMRQMVKLASITKIFTDKGNGKYNCKLLTTKKNVEWDGWELNKEFQGEYLDDSQHKIIFTFDPVRDVLTEKHIVIGQEDKPADVYTYTLDKQGFLVMRMEFDKVVTNRFYKRSDATPAAGGQ